jgi:hypothetical protein
MQSALREWIRIPGQEWVITSQEDLHDASAAIFAHNRVARNYPPPEHGIGSPVSLRC